MSIGEAQFAALKTEVLSDPLGLGYAAMTNAQVVTSLNGKTRNAAPQITSAQIFEAIDPGEFSALLPAAQARVDRLLGLGSGIEIAPGSKARGELVAIFGAGSNTIVNLANYIKVSRATELGLPPVVVAWIKEARGG